MNERESILLTPGPVRSPQHVLEALQRQPIHHRTEEFRQLYGTVQEGLRYFFQTRGTTMAIYGSGTDGMYTLMRDLIPEASTVVVQANGKFSDRWLTYAQGVLGMKVIPLRAEWGQSPDVEAVEKILDEHGKEPLHWILTHVETSGGDAIDLEQMAFTIKEHRPDHSIYVDAICSAGIQALYTDAWKLDAVVAAGPKGLRNPAGTFQLALGSRMADRLQSLKNAGEGNLLARHMAGVASGDYPVTPPTVLLYGLQAELEFLKEETLPRRWNRIQQLNRYFRSRMSEWGGKVWGRGRAFGLTAFQTEDDRDWAKLREQLRQHHGITLANAQSPFKGQFLRIGHFGDVDEQMTAAAVEALKAELNRS